MVQASFNIREVARFWSRLKEAENELNVMKDKGYRGETSM